MQIFSLQISFNDIYIFACFGDNSVSIDVINIKDYRILIIVE